MKTDKDKDSVDKHAKRDQMLSWDREDWVLKQSFLY